MEKLPFEDLPPENRWDDMGSYYEGDLLALPIQPVTDWPPYEQLSLGSTEAPNGWGGAREYWESHQAPEGAE